MISKALLRKCVQREIYGPLSDRGFVGIRGAKNFVFQRDRSVSGFVDTVSLQFGRSLSSPYLFHYTNVVEDITLEPGSFQLGERLHFHPIDDTVEWWMEEDEDIEPVVQHIADAVLRVSLPFFEAFPDHEAGFRALQALPEQPRFRTSELICLARLKRYDEVTRLGRQISELLEAEIHDPDVEDLAYFERMAGLVKKLCRAADSGEAGAILDGWSAQNREALGITSQC